MKRVGSEANARLPGLDGLRAVACLAVFAVHSGQIAHVGGSLGPFDLGRLLENGNTGVALFFALSGFLLSLPFWRALVDGTPAPATGRYLLRRAARIVPAYYACLTGLIVVGRFWNEGGWMLDAALHYVFAFNFSNDTVFGVNPPFWTIAVEVQFYLLLPLLFLPLRRARAGVVAAVLATLAVAAYALNVVVTNAAIEAAGSGAWPPTGIPPIHVYSLLAHLPHFLLGTLTAWMFAVWRPRPAEGSWGGAADAVLWIAAILVFVVLATPLDDVLRIPHGRYNLPFVPLLLCVVILLVPRTATGRVVFDSAPFRGLGAVSFGVYLYHLPIQHVTARVMERVSLAVPDHALLFGAASLVATIVVATLSYWIVERPIVRLARHA